MHTRRIRFFIHKLFRKPKNGFNHIISLGYNCETAFRFLKYFRFEEASLFNWAASETFDTLIHALENLDKIGMDGFQLYHGLWKCNNTKICWHGRQKMNVYLEHRDTELVRQQDVAELSARIQYLKQKFIKIAQGEDTKLFIYKLHTPQISNETANKILKLHQVLTDVIQAKNFKLLIVHEQGVIHLPENSNYMVRTVKCFAPDAYVHSRQHMTNGWDKIFAEFYPTKIIKRNKTYKFDN